MAEQIISGAKRLLEIAVLIIGVSAILVQLGGRFQRQDTVDKAIDKFEAKMEYITSQNSQDHTMIKLDIKEIQTELKAINRKLP